MDPYKRPSSRPSTPGQREHRPSLSSPSTNNKMRDMILQMEYKNKQLRAESGASAASTPTRTRPRRQDADADADVSQERSASASEPAEEHDEAWRKEKVRKEKERKERKEKDRKEKERKEREEQEKLERAVERTDRKERKKRVKGDGQTPKEQKDTELESRHHQDPSSALPPSALSRPEFTGAQYQSQQPPPQYRPRQQHREQHPPHTNHPEDDDQEQNCDMFITCITLCWSGVLSGLSKAVDAWWMFWDCCVAICWAVTRVFWCVNWVWKICHGATRSGVRDKETARSPNKSEVLEFPPPAPSDTRQDLPPPSHEASPSYARRLGKSLVALFVLGLAFIIWLWSPQPTYQPVDDLIHATHMTTTALDFLNNTATAKSDARLLACKVMEASAELYRRPRESPDLVKAWAPEKGHSGWGCPEPAWLVSGNNGKRREKKKKIFVPTTAPDEKLGALGVQLAGELWNITLLLRRSSEESFIAAQGVRHLATQIQRELRRSDFCHNSWSLSRPAASRFFLNSKLAQVNSTLSTFAASQSSLIADLQVSATICRQLVGKWEQAGRVKEFTEGRAKLLPQEINTMCKSLVQSAGEKDRVMTAWMGSAAMEAISRLPPFLRAKERFDETRDILLEIRTSSRRGGSPWIAYPPTQWFGGRNSKAFQIGRHRCWVLGAPEGEEDETDEEGRTLLQLARRMEDSATKAGSVRWRMPR